MIEARWLVAVAAAALGFASLSVLVAVRRLYFLAAGLTHSALTAAALAIPLSATVGGAAWAWATLLAVAMATLVWLLLEKGYDPQLVSAVFVSAAASAAVIAMHYVLTSYPHSGELWSLVIGDPLLVPWSELVPVTAASLAAAAYMATTYWEHVCIAVDRDTARMAGLRVGLYDASLLALLAAVTVLLLRIAGFVLAHVYLLLPGAFAVTAASRASAVPVAAVAAALASSVAGLLLAVQLDLAPSGAVGLVMLALYVAAVALGGRR